MKYFLSAFQMHIEAAKMLSFTEEEFVKALEWGNWDVFSTASSSHVSCILFGWACPVIISDFLRTALVYLNCLLCFCDHHWQKNFDKKYSRQ